MQPADDSTFLRQYVENHSDEAFAALVTRHVNLVYSVALRQTGNSHHAEEITQAVFIILAQKAAQLRHYQALSSWLFQTTRLTAANFVRSEIRRHQREEEAYMQSVVDESAGAVWPKIAPLLDLAVAGLREKDRQAIILRFYEDRNLREIGLALGASEAAAEKRVSRALEKLRKFLAKQGVASTTAMLAGAMSAHSVQAAPAGLAQSVTVLAAAHGAAAAGFTPTLTQGALKLMAWTKTKIAMAAGVGILLAAGTTVATVKAIQNHRDDNYPWQIETPTPEMLMGAPPLVKIVPTKFPNAKTQQEVTMSGPEPGMTRSVGIAVYAYDILKMACDENRRERILALTKIPTTQKYDFIVSLPTGDLAALQQEIRKKLGLVGRSETITTNVLLLQVKYPGPPGLKPGVPDNGFSARNVAGEISFADQGCKILASALGNNFRMPVLDATGLTNSDYYDLKWEVSRQPRLNQMNLKQALLNQLGLELVPDQQPVDMLVVEKAK